MQSGTICIRDLNLCYRVAGTGPDVLFIHGWGSSSRMWTAVMKGLADRFRCWAVDLPGFGDSDKPANGWYALPKFTATLRQFAAAAGLRRTHVVGHSMGGMIALDLAAAEPGLVCCLVVVNPVVTGRIATPLPGGLDQSRRAPLLRLAGRAWPAALSFAARHPRSAAAAAWGLFRRRADIFKPTTASALGGLRAITGYDTTLLLPRIAAPTLVVIGNHDPVISPAEGRLAASRIPGARLEARPAGHQIADERPREFLALLSAFLSAAN